jgi:uncharacterized protein YoaH (UPF0181 family)
MNAEQFMELVRGRLKNVKLGPDERHIRLTQSYKPPSKERTFVLRAFCALLLDNPDLIQSPWNLMLCELMQAFLAVAKDPQLKQENIAHAVDHLIANGMSPGEARKTIAVRARKTESAVKQAHVRFKRKARRQQSTATKRRDKSR